MFSKYHYLSEKLSGGLTFNFGLFLNDEQIGFINYAEYTPWTNKTKRRILHSNRLVIHPDYVGFGLGIKFINITSRIMLERKYKVMTKFSSAPVYRSMIKNKEWRFVKTQIFTPSGSEKMTRKSGFRDKVKCWVFEYIGSKL